MRFRGFFVMVAARTGDSPVRRKATHRNPPQDISLGVSMWIYVNRQEKEASGIENSPVHSPLVVPVPASGPRPPGCGRLLRAVAQRDRGPCHGQAHDNSALHSDDGVVAPHPPVMAPNVAARFERDPEEQRKGVNGQNASPEDVSASATHSCVSDRKRNENWGEAPRSRQTRYLERYSPRASFTRRIARMSRMTNGATDRDSVP